MNHDKQYTQIEMRIAALERLILQPEPKRIRVKPKKKPAAKCKPHL